MSPGQRRELVDRRHRDLSIVRQCQLLGVSRSSLYYRAKGTSEQDLGTGPVLAAGAGPPVPGDPLLRFQADEGLAGKEGHAGKPEAGAAAHESDGAACHLPAAQHQPPVAGEPGLSLPAEECENHPAQPGVGRGHHLPAHGPRGPLPGGGDGLAQAVRGGLAAVQHPPIGIGGRLWRPASAPRRWRRLWARVGRRCSTPTRGASSPAWSSPRSSRSKG